MRTWCLNQKTKIGFTVLVLAALDPRPACTKNCPVYRSTISNTIFVFSSKIKSSHVAPPLIPVKLKKSYATFGTKILVFRANSGGAFWVLQNCKSDGFTKMSVELWESYIVAVLVFTSIFYKVFWMEQLRRDLRREEFFLKNGDLWVIRATTHTHTSIFIPSCCVISRKCWICMYRGGETIFI